MKRIIVPCAMLLLLVVSLARTQTPLPAYEALLRDIKTHRENLHHVYISSDSIKRDSVIAASRQYVFRLITHRLFDYWYGTPWHFYGTTRTPKQGTIACGYFVTAVLSDAGFNIPRTVWAQLASEVFIKKMSNDLKRFHNRPIEDVTTYIRSRPDGLYLVGLDCHVGFIYKEKDTLLFVHSNYYQPSIGVMAEKFSTVNPLRDSKYRVIGRLLDDKAMIKWLSNQRIE